MKKFLQGCKNPCKKIKKILDISFIMCYYNYRKKRKYKL